jgi:hypothetical protein
MNNKRQFIGQDLKDCFGQPAMRTLSLDISPDIVNNSIRGDFNHCMVADALQQKFPSASYINVDVTGIRFTYNGLRYFFLPPPKVRNYISDFDAGKHIHPFKFVAADLVRVVPGGQGAFGRTHPKGDNRTNPRKKYDAAKKKRNYGTRKRIGGICITTYK